MIWGSGGKSRDSGGDFFFFGGGGRARNSGGCLGVDEKSNRSWLV